MRKSANYLGWNRLLLLPLSNTHTPTHTSHTHTHTLLHTHSHSLSLLKNLTHYICLSQTYTNTHQYADIEDSMTHADFCLLFTHPQTHTLIHIPTHTHPHPYTHTCPYTNTHTCSYTHIHIRTQTHNFHLFFLPSFF